MAPQNPDITYELDLSIQDPAWEDLPGIEDLVAHAVEASLKTAILPRKIEGRPLEISLVLANDDLVQVLNNDYRGKDKPTNVLTFAALDDEDMPDIKEEAFGLGDVILAYQTVEREAADQGKFIQDHTAHLVVHGILHLLGYDHETEDEANVMESTEIRILETLGIQNPYTEV